MACLTQFRWASADQYIRIHLVGGCNFWTIMVHTVTDFFLPLQNCLDGVGFLFIFLPLLHLLFLHHHHHLWSGCVNDWPGDSWSGFFCFLFTSIPWLKVNRVQDNDNMAALVPLQQSCSEPVAGDGLVTLWWDANTMTMNEGQIAVSYLFRSLKCLVSWLWLTLLRLYSSYSCFQSAVDLPAIMLLSLIPDLPWPETLLLLIPIPLDLSLPAAVGDSPPDDSLSTILLRSDATTVCTLAFIPENFAFIMELLVHGLVIPKVVKRISAFIWTVVWPWSLPWCLKKQCKIRIAVKKMIDEKVPLPMRLNTNHAEIKLYRLDNAFHVRWDNVTWTALFI